MKTVTTTVKEGSPMTVESRIFSVAEYVQPSEGEPIRSVVLETRDSIIVVWHVHPGQEIAAHIHPHGQDTWTVLSGMADYFQGNGIVRALREGEIAVARPGLPDDGYALSGLLNRRAGKRSATRLIVTSSSQDVSSPACAPAAHGLIPVRYRRYRA